MVCERVQGPRRPERVYTSAADWQSCLRSLFFLCLPLLFLAALLRSSSMSVWFELLLKSTAITTYHDVLMSLRAHVQIHEYIEESIAYS